MILGATLRSISEPFDAGNRVEIKLALDLSQTIEGELYLRIPASWAKDYVVGDVYAVSVKQIWKK